MRKSAALKRPVSGILLLDKPSGITSNAALQKSKRLFNARKAGHTGTLDPLATGMLPLCFGEATKLSSFLLDSNKSYRTVAQLGEVTDTGDSDGEVIRQRPVPDGLDRSQIESVLARLRGTTSQVPPMYSALKHQGKRLHELARAGQTVERSAREVTISRLELLDSGADWFEIDVDCSKGTYIRSLVQDIGEALGCGAHLTALRRTGVSPFQGLTMHSLDDLLTRCRTGPMPQRAVAADATLEDLTAVSHEPFFAPLDECLLAPDSVLSHLPRLALSSAEQARFCHGNGFDIACQRLEPPAVDSTGVARSQGDCLTRIYTSQQSFLGLAEVVGEPSAQLLNGVGSQDCQSLLQVRPKRVLNI